EFRLNSSVVSELKLRSAVNAPLLLSSFWRTSRLTDAVRSESNASEIRESTRGHAANSHANGEETRRRATGGGCRGARGAAASLARSALPRTVRPALARAARNRRRGEAVLRRAQPKRP